jgi:hypothetical protein
MVAHSCNAEYLEHRDGGLWFENSLGKKLARPNSTIKLTWWYMPAILVCLKHG